MPSEHLHSFQEFQSLIDTHPIRVSYLPFSDERDPTTIPLLNTINIQTIIHVPQNHRHDPVKFATTLSETNDPSKLHLLIPGQLFDKAGTRHGRGRGWYDRLLAHLPPEIPRIGIVSTNQLSPTTLLRNPWDEPVDWLIYQKKENWLIYKTNARTPQPLVKS